LFGKRDNITYYSYRFKFLSVSNTCELGLCNGF
jgi:hypothetical protein